MAGTGHALLMEGLLGSSPDLAQLPPHGSGEGRRSKGVGSHLPAESLSEALTGGCRRAVPPHCQEGAPARGERLGGAEPRGPEWRGRLFSAGTRAGIQMSTLKTGCSLKYRDQCFVIFSIDPKTKSRPCNSAQNWGSPYFVQSTDKSSLLSNGNDRKRF